MLTHEENELLCRVENGAPMGEIFRRHWLPAGISSDVEERDGDPVRTRLLGEDLILFRDSDGRLGAMDEYCPHRRASLAYGRNEECGLRCLYHGWKIDVDGNILEMPSEPPETGFVDKVKHKAYPVHEAAGLVWIYMGPPETKPEFEPPIFQPTPDTKISTSRIIIDCNWAQILEGAIDSAHSSSLHSSDMLPARIASAEATDRSWLRPSTDKAPRLQVEHADWGFQYAALRRPIVNAATHDYVRTTLFIAPFTVQIPPTNQYRVAILHVPMDDAHTAFHFIAWGGETVPEVETWRKFIGAQVGIDVDREYRKLRTRANNYLQDRTAMRLGNFTGVRGIPNQDIVMWETMGPIADRSRERLGASDVAVVEFRRQMVEAARRFVRTGEAIGRFGNLVAPSKLMSFEGVIPKATDWRGLAIRGAASPVKQAVPERV